MGLVKAKRECGRNLKEFNLALKYYAKSGLFTLCFELEGYLRATSVPYLFSGEFILQAGALELWRPSVAALTRSGRYLNRTDPISGGRRHRIATWILGLRLVARARVYQIDYPGDSLILRHALLHPL
jgi:hypothetical protein